MRKFSITLLLFPMTEEEAQEFADTLGDLVLTYIRSEATAGEAEVGRGT